MKSKTPVPKVLTNYSGFPNKDKDPMNLNPINLSLRILSSI